MFIGVLYTNQTFIIKLSIRITLPPKKTKKKKKNKKQNKTKQKQKTKKKTKKAIYNQIIMSITPNKYKLYETNLKFGFYLGREAKK